MFLRTTYVAASGAMGPPEFAEKVALLKDAGPGRVDGPVAPPIDLFSPPSGNGSTARRDRSEHRRFAGSVVCRRSAPHADAWTPHRPAQSAALGPGSLAGGATRGWGAVASGENGAVYEAGWSQNSFPSGSRNFASQPHGSFFGGIENRTPRFFRRAHARRNGSSTSRRMPVLPTSDLGGFFPGPPTSQRWKRNFPDRSPTVVQCSISSSKTRKPRVSTYHFAAFARSRTATAVDTARNVIGIPYRPRHLGASPEPPHVRVDRSPPPREAGGCPVRPGVGRTPTAGGPGRSYRSSRTGRGRRGRSLPRPNR